VDEATSDELREHLLTDGGAEEDADLGGAEEDAGLGGGANAGTDGDDENANRIPMRDSLVSLRDPEECAWRLSRPAHVALTLSIIAVQFLLAIVTPNIEVALGFMGSTLSVLIARGAAIEAGASTGVSTAVLAFGFAVGASGLTVATWNAVSPPK
jgi:hypothetical protein